MLGSEAFRMAVGALWGRKLRSVMTIIGVVIGVSSVLAVTTLGAAFESSLISNFDDLDDRSVFVTATLSDVSQGPPDAGQFGLIFTEADRQGLAALEGVERATASGQVPVSGIATENRDIPFRTLTATTAAAAEIRDAADYFEGSVFQDGQAQLVLGWTIAVQLGDGGPVPVGTSVMLRLVDGSTETATVAGVLARQESLFGSNNAQVFVPVDPFYNVQRQSPSTGETVRVFDGFSVIAADPRDVEAVRDRVRAYMDDQSDANRLLTEDLEILVATPSDITAGISAAFDQATLFIAAIAAVSLLVGGIMIGTIMLISVAERTREIGMMKAIGAKDREILLMFLLEASLIGLIGSVIGVAAGLGVGAALISALFDEETTFVLAWDWLIIAVLVGIGTGVVAGLLPARRAVKVNPVQALGYE